MCQTTIVNATMQSRVYIHAHAHYVRSYSPAHAANRHAAASRDPISRAVCATKEAVPLFSDTDRATIMASCHIRGESLLLYITFECISPNFAHLYIVDCGMLQSLALRLTNT